MKKQQIAITLIVFLLAISVWMNRGDVKETAIGLAPFVGITGAVIREGIREETATPRLQGRLLPEMGEVQKLNETLTPRTIPQRLPIMKSPLSPRILRGG